jgi:hypothetical protein
MTNNSGSLKIASSLLQQAIANDTNAIELMFQQFLPDGEKIHYVQYLGVKGLWGIGTHDFVCLTDLRVADVTVGWFGEIVYQDGYIDNINSQVIYQPSKLGLYLTIGSYSLLIIFYSLAVMMVNFFLSVTVVSFALLLLPLLVKVYYRWVKCGIVFNIKEGIPVYIFANRRYISKSNELCRYLAIVREDRLKVIKKMHY